MAEVKITLYPDQIKRLEQACKRAFYKTAAAVLTDIQQSQTVPKDTGALEQSGHIEVDVENMTARIIFDTPYARRLYWHPEYNFRQDMNPHAQGLWMQTYIDGPKKDFVRDTFAAFLKQESGGLIK